MSSKVKEINLKKLKPYGDIMDDGTVQLAFTLPVEPSPEAREAAVQLVQKMLRRDDRVSRLGDVLARLERDPRELRAVAPDEVRAEGQDRGVVVMCERCEERI